MIARVVPHDIHDRLLQIRADVWMQPGVTAEELPDSLAPFYRRTDPPGRVALVLGAGDNAFLTPADMLSAMIVDGDAVVVKMNPVNGVYGPVLERILAPPVDAGYARFVYGGAEVGAELVRDERVERVHVTGSAATHEAIGSGSGPDAATRRRRAEPLLDKPVTAEPGGVGPTIVVSGRWTSADTALRARIVATQRLFGSGHICAASQVLVLPEAWPQAGSSATSGSPGACRPTSSSIRGSPDPGAPGWRNRIAELQAGNIGVTTPTMLSAGFGRCEWGAFPGNHPRDIGSGVGFVHNASMFPHPQKNVGWGDFRPSPHRPGAAGASTR